MTGHARHTHRTRSVAAGRKNVGCVATLARAATKGVAADGVAAEERGRRAAGGMGWLDIGKRRWQNGIGGRCRRGGGVRGVGVEGVGGGMAGGVLAAIAGRRPRRQRRRQRWPAPASGAGRHLEMGLGPANEQEGQNVRAWRLGINMLGLGMRSGGCECEIQGARGAGGGAVPPARARGSSPPSVSP